MSHAPYDPTHPAPAAWQPQAPVQGRSPSRVLPVLGGTLGVLGLIVGAAGCSQAVSSRDAAAPSYSEQQVADAKKAVCEAYERGVRAFRIAANRKVEDPADKLPVAVNTRLAEVAVGNYLNNTVEANPASPSELQDAIHQLSRAYEDIALTQLAEGTAPDVEPFGRSADDAIAKISGICQ